MNQVFYAKLQYRKNKDVVCPVPSAFSYSWYPSFHIGNIFGKQNNSAFSLEIFILGVLGVILIMLSTYHSGEYFDYREDEISHRFYKNKFAGGSGVIPAGKISPSRRFLDKYHFFASCRCHRRYSAVCFKNRTLYIAFRSFWELSPVSFIPPNRSDWCKEALVKFSSAFVMAGCR